MAFDWTKVPGYNDSLTAEEKLQLLNAFEPADPGKTVSKELYDKLATEHAATKKTLKERMSEEERIAAEREASDKALRDELELLRKERAESGFRAKLLEAKYSADDAAKLAKSAAEGDMTAFFEALSKANESTEKALRAELMRGTPRPGPGMPQETDNAVEVAKSIARGRNESAKAANDALSHYI